MSQERFEELDENLKTWIEFQINEGSQMLRNLAGEDEEASILLGLLDEAFSNALGQEWDEEMVTTILNCIGVNFGQYLVDRVGFEWCVVNDEYGCDLAVVTCRGRGDVTVYPIDFVSKRWERKEDYFLEEAFGEIVETVENVKAEWRERK